MTEKQHRRWVYRGLGSLAAAQLYWVREAVAAWLLFTVGAVVVIPVGIGLVAYLRWAIIELLKPLPAQNTAVEPHQPPLWRTSWARLWKTTSRD